MASSAISFAAKGVTSTLDQASTTLAAGIISSDLSISLATGGGAKFPQPYNGTATSGGTTTTLNCTGISATIGGSAAIGKMIRNVTDGSIAWITSVSTNSLTTTALYGQGASDNTWENSDAWRIDEFVVTFATQTTNAYGVISDTVLEEALVIARSTDTLTIASGGRGYNGTTASSFNSGDAVQLRVTSAVHEGLRYSDFEIAKKLDSVASSQTTDETNITNLQTGAYFYVVTTGSANAYVAATPALAAYAAGNVIVFNANFTNTGSATLNVNSLGAKTIKKNDGATNLAANDIVSGQLVVVRYDGTNFQMMSPVGTPGTLQHYAKVVYISGASSGANANPTSYTAFDTHTYSVPANDITATVGYEFEAAFTATVGAGSLELGIGFSNNALATCQFGATGTRQYLIRGFIMGTAAAGASVAVRSGIVGGVSSVTAADATGNYVTGNFATNGGLTLNFIAKFSSSNGSNTTTCTMAKFTKVSSSTFA